MQPIRVDETVRSMSIAQALRTEQAHSQAPFTLDGLEIGSVSIVANILNVRELGSCTSYELSDGTGTIAAKQWLPIEESRMFRTDTLKMDRKRSTFHTIVRVTGMLDIWHREGGGGASEQITTYSLNLYGMSLSSPWEQYSHFLRVVVDTLTRQQGPPPPPPPPVMSPPDTEDRESGQTKPITMDQDPDISEDIALEEGTSDMQYIRDRGYHDLPTANPMPQWTNKNATSSSLRPPPLTSAPVQSTNIRTLPPLPSRSKPAVEVIDLTAEDDSDSAFLTAEEDTTLDHVTSNLASASLKTPKKDRKMRMPDSSPRNTFTSMATPKRRTNHRSEQNTPSSSSLANPRVNAPKTPTSASKKRDHKRDPYWDLSQTEREILVFMSPTGHRSLYAFNDAASPPPHSHYEGIHKSTLVRSMQARHASITEEQILVAISVLLEKAHIYMTIDNDHYART